MCGHGQRVVVGVVNNADAGGVLPKNKEKKKDSVGRPISR